MEYRTEVDIGNRALQHCGAKRMNPTQGFAENSKNASEVSFCYGKCREAELRTNVWTFATRVTVLRPIDSTTMLLNAAMWNADTTCFVGSIVSSETGNLWISNTPNNLGNQPEGSLTWEPYFGPLTVQPYTSGTSYFAGELVYTAPGDGTSRVYLSRASSNTDAPATATAYAATTTYSKNHVVTYLSVSYMSLIDLNTGNTPSAAPALWNVATTYAAAARVGGSDGVIYASIGSGNVGIDPTSDDGVHWTNTGVLNPWTTVFVGGVGSDKWLLIGGPEFPNGVGLVTPNILYPIGTGPASQSASRNVYRLPSGFLRVAPQNAKAPIAWLGGPTGITYTDWQLQDGFLITSDGGPIPFRCVVNVRDVRRMDAMFCEGLAARVALEVCEPITQSTSKLGTIAKVYDEWINKAKTANAIEQGSEDPPDDDYVTVRN